MVGIAGPVLARVNAREEVRVGSYSPCCYSWHSLLWLVLKMVKGPKCHKMIQKHQRKPQTRKRLMRKRTIKMMTRKMTKEILKMTRKM